MPTADEAAADRPKAPIRVGVVGANPTRGWATAAHLPALQALEEYEITAVATTRPETARATAEAYGVPLAFSDANELMAHPDVEVVVVTVRLAEHDRLIRAALEHGKHVFSEWPLGIDAAQSRQLATLAEAQGVRHLVGLQGYHAPGAAYVRELIEQGAIGQPVAVSVVTPGGPGTRIPETNLYSIDGSSGATTLTLTGGHVLATLARAIGQPRSLSAVVATVNPHATVVETGEPVTVTAPDQVSVTAHLDNGAILSLAVQGGAAPPVAVKGSTGAPAGPGFQARIVGSEAILSIQPANPGSLQIADWAITIARANGEVEALPVPSRFVPIPDSVPAGPPRNVAMLYKVLANGIADGQPVSPDFAAAAEQHEVLEAIQRASDTGMVQKVESQLGSGKAIFRSR